MRLVQGQQLETVREGGKRCMTCFQMRLKLVAEAALIGGYDYFGSALTLLPKRFSTD